MIAGVDWIRKRKKISSTLWLVHFTNSEGQKMGKTAKGALWLDAGENESLWILSILEKYSRCWHGKMFSLVDIFTYERSEKVRALKDAEINEAKKVLAMKLQN